MNKNNQLRYLIKKVSNLNRIYKTTLLLVIDILCSISALYIAISIITKDFLFNILEYPVILFISSFLFIPIFYSTGHYQAILRYLGYNFIIRIFFSILIYGVVFYFLNFFISFFYENLIISILQPLIFFIFVLYARVILIFIIKEFSEFNNKQHNKVNIIVYGAGAAGFDLSLKNYDFKIACFIDDDINKINTRINNIPIFNFNEIQKLIVKYNANLLLIAIPSLNIYQRSLLISKLEKFNIPIKITPRIEDLLTGVAKINDYNFIPSDFVKRKINWDNIYIEKYINHKCVLITGAGGSIGSELSRQISSMNPKKIILVDNSEYNLFKIFNEINNITNDKKITINSSIKIILASVTDKKKLESAFNTYKPEIVFHAAAYKHVSLLEENPIEAIKNNVLGTYYVCNSAVPFNVEKVVFISTDKSIKPKSIMGASKRISEIILLNFINEKNKSKTKFSIVRFGNVINSNGSVIPIFAEQIKNGGPVTVTHPDVTRYFMTIPEAVGLVLETSVIAKNGDKFILDMGSPIKILDIAKKMIKLAGLTNNLDNKQSDIKIDFIGLRKGEKLHEDITMGKEFIKTNNEFIFMDGYEENFELEIQQIVTDVKSLVEQNDITKVNDFFKKYIKDCLI